MEKMSFEYLALFYSIALYCIVSLVNVHYCYYYFSFIYSFIFALHFSSISKIINIKCHCPLSPLLMRVQYRGS